MFGLSEVQAHEAELAAASVRIQALARKKQANAVTVERRLKAMEKQEVAAVYTKALWDNQLWKRRSTNFYGDAHANLL